jgi:hypothetical protein
MEIPKSVYIIDTVVRIEYETMVNELGFADYTNDRIIIAKNVNESKKIEIFWHELTHWILFKMGSKLECDEDFVYLFGSILNQATKNISRKERDVR